MSSPASPAQLETPSLRRLVVQGIEVRLRFVFALLVLAGIMVAWPWFRVGWDRVASLWHGHSHGESVSGTTEFFCPMDPGVTSGWPAICPICNMDLIPRDKSDCLMLPEGVVARMQFSPYRIKLAGISTASVETKTVETSAADEDTEPVVHLTVPASAVVHHGDVDVVYVESMSGMFDGVPVKLGEREADRFVVLSGLKPGQRVVSAGAYLVDAESRLNPALATQYFGAASKTPLGQAPAAPKRRSKSDSLEGLSKEDQLLVAKQKICPVTGGELGSMGKPVARTVKGRKVFLCCEGCEGKLFSDPDECLARIDEAAQDHTEEAH
jgi:hypothetical protein